MHATGNGVLVVTQKFDPHTDRLLPILQRRGVPFFRLNTDDFLDEHVVSTALDRGVVRIRDAWGRTVTFPDEIAAVWYRKPVAATAPRAVTDAETARVIAAETGEFLASLWSLPVERLVNDPARNERAAHKLPQLVLAARLGLTVPRTLVTNDPAEARAFVEGLGGPATCKSMKAYGYREGGEERFIFARRVEPADFAATADAVALCPTLLQAYIEKDHELRVTIIGERTFCCRIDSQVDGAARTDWRRADPFDLPHRIVPLDATVERALRAMMAAHGLAYGAFDLIVTPKGEIVFLEMNPNGQWLWIEMITEAPMAEAMADLLVGSAT